MALRVDTWLLLIAWLLLKFRAFFIDTTVYVINLERMEANPATKK